MGGTTHIFGGETIPTRIRGVWGQVMGRTRRLEMSLHSSQISAGITPHFINRPKITQPRQNPAKAFFFYDTVKTEIYTYDTVGAPNAHATDAPTVNTAPIP